MNAIPTLVLFLFSVLAAPSSPATTSESSKRGKTRYWPTTAKEVGVEIDGYDFDFEAPISAKGVVDGPFTHNGAYRIRKNELGSLHMAVHFGTDTRQRNDMDVDLRIDGDQATVTGTVRGKDVGTRTANVRKVGKHFVIEFTVRTGKGKSTKHTIRWRAP